MSLVTAAAYRRWIRRYLEWENGRGFGFSKAGVISFTASLGDRPAQQRQCYFALRFLYSEVLERGALPKLSDLPYSNQISPSPDKGFSFASRFFDNCRRFLKIRRGN